MPRKGWTETIAPLLLLAIVCGCSKSSVPESAKQTSNAALKIYTVNYPLQYFAQRIGGQHAEVIFPAPVDQDPSLWSPDVETVLEYQQADLIVLQGGSYAKWISRASLPLAKRVNTTYTISNRFIEIEDAVRHSHGPGDEHSHGGVALTTWLNPELAIEQARSIHKAMIRLRPQFEADFDHNLELLENDLTALDQRLRDATAMVADQAVVFSHPVYQYLQRRYQLEGRAVDWEPSELPSAEQWKALAKLLEQHPAKWMIWEGEPKAETVERLAELGLESVVVSPCGNRPASGDWLSAMETNADELARVFSADADQDR